jgi:hypothetical protein
MREGLAREPEKGGSGVLYWGRQKTSVPLISRVPRGVSQTFCRAATWQITDIRRSQDLGGTDDCQLEERRNQQARKM